MNETMIEKGFTEPTDRVKRLKKMIVEARPMVETYRAQLVTQTYKETEGMTAIMRRAKVDENLFNNLPIVIRDEELIVGSPCVHPRSSDVGIEYSYADLANELETMQTRTCDQFDISEEDKEVVRHFDDYWKGHTMSDYAWSLMSPECQACQTHAVFNAGNYMYAGVGHVCCYYEKVLKIGFQGIIKEVLEGGPQKAGSDQAAAVLQGTADYLHGGDQPCTPLRQAGSGDGSEGNEPAA